MRKDNLTSLLEDAQARGYDLTDIDIEILKILCKENRVLSHCYLTDCLSEFKSKNSELLVRLARLNQIGLICLNQDNIYLKIGS